MAACRPELRRVALALVWAGAAFSVLCPRLAAQGDAVRLSAAPRERISARDVRDFEYSPDGNWLFYTANQEDGFFRSLYVTPARGRLQVRRLDGGGLTSGGVSSFELVPAAGRVLYRADVAQFGRHELFSVPLQGGAPVRLHPPLASGGLVEDFALVPGGQRVLFDARTSGTERAALFVAPLDGSSPPVPLGSEPFGAVLEFELDASGTQVVFRASFGNPNLYVAPLDGSAPPLRLNPDLGSFGRVGDATPHPAFVLAPAGDFVLYRSDFASLGSFALWRVPLSGGASVRLDAGLLPGESVQAVRLSPDGQAVVFSKLTSSGQRLFVVPSDASTAARALAFGPGQHDFLEFTHDASAVLVRSNAPTLARFELQRLPLDGSPAVTLSRVGFGAPGVETCRITADRRTVVYSADENGAGRAELYRVAADGTGLRQPLTVAGDEGDVEAFELDSRGRRAFYLRNLGPTSELFAVPLDLSVARVRLDGPTIACGGRVRAFRPAPDGASALYRADALRPGQEELFLARADGAGHAVRVQPPLGAPFLANFVSAFVPTPDGRSVVYASDEAHSGQQEVFLAPLDGSAPPVPLASAAQPCGSLAQLSLQLAPDGSRAFFLGDLDQDERVELFSVTLDGEKPPVRLNGALIPSGDVFTGLGKSYVLTSDGSRVAFLADAEANERFELYVTASDGLGARTNPVSRDVLNLEEWGDFEFTPDGANLLAVADLVTAGKHELFRIPADASGPPVRLSAPAIAAGDVREFERVDAERVLYASDQETNEKIELYLARLDGSEPARKLSGPLAAGGNVARVFHATPEHALYLADATTDGQFELFSVRYEVGASPLRLSAPLPSGGTIRLLTPTRDGAQVVYFGDQDLTGRSELYVATVDGSAAVRKLNAPLRGAEDVSRFVVGATHVAYSRRAGDVHALFATPLDLATPPLELTPPLPAGATLGTFVIEPDGRHVLYQAEQETDDVPELFRVPIDGSEAPRRLHPSLPTFGPGQVAGVEDTLRLTRDGRHVLFTAWLAAGERALLSVELEPLAPAPLQRRR